MNGVAQALRVFLVEDAANMQVALTDLVCSVAESRIVSVVASEAHAVEWANTHKDGWDLAIVDLTLEQGDGFRIVQQLAQHQPRGAIVVFSAFVTDPIRRYCSTLGADAVFHKTQSAELASYVEALGAA